MSLLFFFETSRPIIEDTAGDTDIKNKLLKGHKAGAKKFNVHLDGYNMLPYWTGEVPESPRKEMFYFTDDGQLSALRYGQWKVMFTEQRSHGIHVWQDPYVTLRAPKIINLLRDPFERADWESGAYEKWYFERLFLPTPAAAYVGQFIGTFQEYPPRQKPGSFNLDRVLESLQKPASTN